jgi:hypothetical protein
MERLNEEVRRRERVIRIFPSRASVIRLLGAVLMEQDEQWTSGKRSFDMAAYWPWHATQEAHAAYDQTTSATPDGTEGSVRCIS